MMTEDSRLNCELTQYQYYLIRTVFVIATKCHNIYIYNKHVHGLV